MKWSPAEVIADNLLRLRRARDITIEDLARESGVAVGALSRLESGAGNPRLDTLALVAAALQAGIEELVRTRELRHSVIRAAEMERDHRFGFTRSVAGRIAEPAIELSWLRVGRPEPSLEPAGTREHLMLFTGQIDLELGEDTFTLKSGDYISFDADAPHRYRAAGCLARGVLVTERRR